MARIKVLPESVARQIAAGEVVERPASVVKELLENALDAGATTVSVRVAGAGSEAIEVRDDGTGIARDDLPLALRSFATSKIASAADLDAIATFGFRGEALASISAVSRLEIVTATDSGREGWRYGVAGKEVFANEPAARERGTTVRVEDLFFNTPARKKFLKSPATEKRRILDTVMAFALAFPAIEVHYADDERTTMDLVAVDEWRERIASLLGGTTMRHIVPVEAAAADLRLRGFASLPTYTRANRYQQFFYVNRRPVREETMAQAVRNAYRGVIPYKRFPAVVLSLEMPADAVDVNVHPGKQEVRFRHPRLVFDVVQRGLKNALSAQTETTQAVRYESPLVDPAQVAQQPGSERHASSLPTPAGGPGGDTATRAGGAARDTSPAPPVAVAADAGTLRVRARRAYDDFMSGAAKLREFNPQLSLQTAPEKEGAKGPSAKELGKQIQAEEALFWQVHNTYIFIQVRGGIVVLDQHAAHERIIHDTCRARLESEIPISQQILFPIHLELTVAELGVFRTSAELFRKLGFHLEPFGGTSILVRGYPQGVKNWQEGRLLLDIFDDIAEGTAPGNSQTDRIVASFACHSAVRAGQKLGLDEMRMLADQLFALPNPYSCPHGRPTIQRIALDEIAGWFDRR